ncbi:MAG: hypothetical protein HYU48_01115 [Candidatus Levybacteria bacterium]|nr:hypothetical protein [Candidatus Levybacteria bacterium]
MSKILKILFFATVIFNLILASWNVLHQDVLFTSEIARDFWLLEELDLKKIILIGPSSTTGLFHGPLWTYVNYPAYFIGNGNPVVVGWFWIFLVIAFLISSFYFAKKLFDKKTAYFFTLMISVYSVYVAKGLYNPHGAMLILPAFFFFFARYIQTFKLRYLIAHILAAGALVQFQMAIGIPFFILSILYVGFISIKQKKFRPIIFYSLIVATLSNFILFDLRHQFLLFRLTLRFVTSAGRDHPDFIGLFYQRFKLMTSGVEFLRVDPGYINLVIFLVFLALVIYQIKNNKYRKVYISFLYFYFGYMLLSLLNSGVLLYFYFFPLFPLAFLIFSSFITSRFSKVFATIFFVIFIFNMQAAISDTKTESLSIGSSKDSWLFLKNAAFKMFAAGENGFGYFVYSPDTVAYREKYATNYIRKNSNKPSYYFQKMPVTYIFIAPPPRSDPFMKEDWWIENQLHINKEPENEIVFRNGYKIAKYKFSKEEVNIDVEPNIDPGLIFR